MIDLTRYKHVHFIGIGGISMSGLAEWLLLSGKAISGSDRADNSQIQRLQAMGGQITIGHNAVAQAQTADLVVYTAAIPPTNPELVAAQQAGVPCISRAELLGTMMAMHPIGIGVAGTHGKTTTTAMLATIFLACQADPSIHLGGVLPAIDGTTKLGHGPHFICEADEYSRSFLKLSPQMAIITNIEHDHPDIYPTLEDIKEVFRTFVSRLPADGRLVIRGDDANSLQASQAAVCPVCTYGGDAQYDYYATDAVAGVNGAMQFTFHAPGGRSWPVRLQLPGMYNVYNATAALAMADLNGLDMAQATAALAEFAFTKRRFELFGHTPAGCRVISDYAHHPTAVSAVLSAGRAVCSGRVFMVFQPHTYSRTAMFLQEYADALQAADNAYVCDIWAARDMDRGQVHARDIVAAAGGNCQYMPDFEQLASLLKQQAGPEDLIICAGAGDIERLCRLLCQ